MSSGNNRPPPPMGGDPNFNAHFSNMGIGAQPFVPNIQAQPFVPIGGGGGGGGGSHMHPGYPNYNYPMPSKWLRGARSLWERTGPSCVKRIWTVIS